MMTKYIIKNCPNFCNWTDNSCSKTWKVDSFNYIQCKEINDCLLKQIVKKCKEKINKYKKNSLLDGYNDILRLLEIEEFE